MTIRKESSFSPAVFRNEQPDPAVKTRIALKIYAIHPFPAEIQFLFFSKFSSSRPHLIGGLPFCSFNRFNLSIAFPLHQSCIKSYLHFLNANDLHLLLYFTARRLSRKICLCLNRLRYFRQKRSIVLWGKIGQTHPRNGIKYISYTKKRTAFPQCALNTIFSKSESLRPPFEWVSRPCNLNRFICISEGIRPGRKDNILPWKPEEKPSRLFS